MESETLYGDGDWGDESAARLLVSRSLSLTFGELETLYEALANANAAVHPAPLVLTVVERVVREVGLWPVQLDIVCYLVGFAEAGPERSNGAAAPRFGDIALSAFTALGQDLGGGLGADDVISLARLVSHDSASEDVLSAVSVDMLRHGLSPSALRALNLGDLRLVLEGLSQLFRERQRERRDRT